MLHVIFVQCNSFLEDNQYRLTELAYQLPPDLTAIVGYVNRSLQACGKPFANAGAVLTNGKLLYSQAKILSPTYDVFDEQRNFEHGGHPKSSAWGKNA
jgi:NAD+ synthase (glutamine-hydrolysing)